VGNRLDDIRKIFFCIRLHTCFLSMLIKRTWKVKKIYIVKMSR
jgi:hypothetical protein